jgi:uncharacterized repeat protein (TIGR04138 family)
MTTGHDSIDWKAILDTAGGYPIEAFEFVRDGLAYTVSRIHEQPDSLPPLARHVSGQQLCLGLRDHALDRWGMMAATVLTSWNIHRTDDFGRIVFAMIEHGVMSKTPQDSLADFRGVFDFDEAFAPSTVAAAFLDRVGPD